MHFAKLASEIKAIKSNPAVLGSGSKAPLLMMMAEEHQLSPPMVLYDNLDKKNKAQVLSVLPPLSKAPLAQEETSEGKGKEKVKASATVEEEDKEAGEFSLLTKISGRT
ncbi:hypothetical protein C0995_016700 [Termitomyces sp. Mi166|nr:hypothetical protein C0995_016700 [Termitomyces sp. Mi166\